jgi:hypothetical protein
VIQGPDPVRDGVVRWRCVDLQREIARRFAVEVHESSTPPVTAAFHRVAEPAFCS